ncbi:MAG: cupin domain-containing protein [Ruminococcaceae bacterium]|nr:cupin domain-containing protein [Oscillospiraceae bacterium]
MSTVNIGGKIAGYRKAHNLTIRALAEKSGLSTALISQMERDLANPSLSVLCALAAAMELSVPELLTEEEDEAALILRKKDRPQTYNPDERYIFYNLLTPASMNAGLRMTLVRCEAHAQTYNGAFHSHANEEIVFVLCGSVTVHFEATHFIICEGDTLRIPPRRKHRYVNNADAAAELLTIESRINR